MKGNTPDGLSFVELTGLISQAISQYWRSTVRL